MFLSKKEKQHWICALVVLTGISLGLFLGRPYINFIWNQNVQAILFLSGFLLVIASIIIYAINTKAKKLEIITILGILSVYIMLIFRLGAPERSHVIEYSILTIFIHMALEERWRFINTNVHPAIPAWILSFSISVIDEVIQIFLPHRVFDYEDLLFNSMAVSMAIGSRILIVWIRNLLKN